jgi:hypothetical protein
VCRPYAAWQHCPFERGYTGPVIQPARAPVGSAPDETPDPLFWGRINCSPGEYRSKHSIKTLPSKKVCNTSPGFLPRLSAS